MQWVREPNTLWIQVFHGEERGRVLDMVDKNAWWMKKNPMTDSWDQCIFACQFDLQNQTLMYSYRWVKRPVASSHIDLMWMNHPRNCSSFIRRFPARYRLDVIGVGIPASNVGFTSILVQNARYSWIKALLYVLYICYRQARIVVDMKPCPKKEISYSWIFFICNWLVRRILELSTNNILKVLFRA